ncbi:MAG: SoxR reducing system RseC family protein [Clostridia bacterium]|nr:SoxR reducing system RseC family protein [Clostridia bacterium]
MKQTAIVKAVVDETAILLVKRQTMCDGCHKESGCGGCSQIIEVRVKNTLNATVGDTVTIETPGATVIGVAALVFLLPLLLAFAAYGVATLFTDSTLYQTLASLITPALAYAVIAIVVRKSKKTLTVEMVDIHS